MPDSFIDDRIALTRQVSTSNHNPSNNLLIINKIQRMPFAARHKGDYLANIYKPYHLIIISQKK